MGMIQEFKDFAMRGNVVDLAVGVVIGAAFGKIVSSLVEKIIMPIVGMITGGVDFSKYDIALKPAVMEGEKVVTPAVNLGMGSFVTTIIDFVIVAFAIFLAVKLMNSMKKKQEAAPPPAPPEDVVLLREIRDALKSR
ncbi:MAG: large conductance mechanosensitive channel protein MscL [Pirellulaceae bacterium]